VQNLPEVIFEHVWMCEMDPIKQTYLLQAFPDIRHLFNDMVEVGNDWAYDIITGTHMRVPKVSW
jgi:hypothetical protein